MKHGFKKKDPDSISPADVAEHYGVPSVLHLCKVLKIEPRTFHNWCNNRPELVMAVCEGYIALGLHERYIKSNQYIQDQTSV